MKCLSLLVVLFLFVSCSEADTTNGNNADMQKDTTNVMDDADSTNNRAFTYLALGDSYTIGESVKEEARWPVQLVNLLRAKVVEEIDDPRIIAKTGWTTDELQQAIDNAELDTPYDLVSLLIGVNNQYRGYPVDQYRTEFESLLEQAIAFAGRDTSRVFIVSIPDYGVTPFAENSDKEKIAQEIDLYNSIAKSYADNYGVKYFDITPISREAENDDKLIANDGLHPSGEMYSRWVDLIFPWASQIFDQ